MLKTTSKFLQLFCCLSLSLLFSANVNATHTMGLDLTYKCLGNNQYEVNLTFYRDCNGINAPSSTTINWSGTTTSGSACSASLRLQKTGVTDITPACGGIVGTACNGGSGIYGIEEHTYQGILTLPAGCANDITLSYSSCCRNNAITTLNSPGSERLYVETHISNTSLCNNSPIFTNAPVPFGCINQPVFYNHGASDVDGDSLSYSLVSCLDRANTPVNYGAGYSATAPLSTTGGVTIDPVTGAISFTPSMAQVGVLCVLVEEYRNGALIGSVTRDIQFTAIACSNNVPTLSGVDNTTNYTAIATAGTQLCFDVHSNDLDANQTTSLAWNNGIAGATFTSAGSPFPVGTFCWTPTAADVGIHTFTVAVSDNYCPIVGQNTYTYTVDVQAPPCDSIDVTITSTTDLTCSSNDGTAILVASNGVAPYTYQLVNWATGEFFTNTTGIFTNLTGGNYSVWVSDANGCAPTCTGHTFTIGGNVVEMVVSTVTTDVACPSNSQNTANANNNDGTLVVNVTGGTPPYLYSIDGTNFQGSNVFTNLSAGIYTGVVIDGNGCSQPFTDTVGEPDPIVIGIDTLIAATCGQANGSVTLTATGGVGGFLYYINGQSQTSPVFANLAAGTYTFSVCDTNYCLYDTTITIPGTPAIVATASATNATCYGACTGTASVAISGGTGTPTVTWSNGMTGASISNLCAGTYTAVVTDATGCSDTATVVITQPNPIVVTVRDLVAETCGQGNGSVTLLATGGVPGYTYSINGQTQASAVFANLAAGTYTFSVIDMNYCVYDTTIVVPGTPGVVATATGTNILCAGACTGEAMVTVTGSSSTITTWNNGMTGNTITNLCAGTYTAIVTDPATGCADTTTVVITEPDSLLATIAVDDVSCSSNSINTVDATNSDGSITVTASGGVAPYSYSIDGTNFQNSGSFTNLGTGTYTVVVLDANGCSLTMTGTVGEPDPISIGIDTLITATCGQANGGVTLTATGGAGGFLYYINGQSQTSPVFTNLAAGTYTFRVCDINYCVYDTTITIPGVLGFTATASSTAPLCHGDCNGSASVTITSNGGNQGSYSVVWNNGMTGTLIENLCAGTYEAIITNSNGCSDTVSVTITEPAAVSVALASTTDETCAGNDGSATLNVSGGTAPYTIDLANFSTATTYSNSTGIFTGLNAGQHVANVVDANGCSVNCATAFVLDGCNTPNVPSNPAGITSMAPLLSVNPNPATSSMVQVRYQTSEKAVSLTILDLNGKPVYNRENLNAEGSLEISVNDWSSATYFVVLKGQKGQVIKTSKLIVAE